MSPWRHRGRRREHGAALLLLLVALVLAGSYALYRGVNQASVRAERDARLALAGRGIGELLAAQRRALGVG